jgi:dienelactone hydrolase
VILLHELPGLAEKCVELADRIARLGYTVFMPLLFGSLYQDSAAKGMVQLCMRREFTLWRMGRSSRITPWLRALAAEVNERTGERGVVAVGMCATGGVVLGMVVETPVRGVVASQPTLPLVVPFLPGRARRQALGLSPADLGEAVAAARERGVPVLAMRFKTDWKCSAERVRRIGEEFPGPEPVVISWPGPPRSPHSVLTYHFSQDGWESLRLFLQTHLPPQSGG